MKLKNALEKGLTLATIVISLSFIIVDKEKL